MSAIQCWPTLTAGTTSGRLRKMRQYHRGPVKATSVKSMWWCLLSSKVWVLDGRYHVVILGCDSHAHWKQLDYSPKAPLSRVSRNLTIQNGRLITPHWVRKVPHASLNPSFITWYIFSSTTLNQSLYLKAKSSQIFLDNQNRETYASLHLDKDEEMKNTAKILLIDKIREVLLNTWKHPFKRERNKTWTAP